MIARTPTTRPPPALPKNRSIKKVQVQAGAVATGLMTLTARHETRLITVKFCIWHRCRQQLLAKKKSGPFLKLDPLQKIGLTFFTFLNVGGVCRVAECLSFRQLADWQKSEKNFFFCVKKHFLEKYRSAEKLNPSESFILFLLSCFHRHPISNCLRRHC